VGRERNRETGMAGQFTPVALQEKCWGNTEIFHLQRLDERVWTWLGNAKTYTIACLLDLSGFGLIELSHHGVIGVKQEKKERRSQVMGNL